MKILKYIPLVLSLILAFAACTDDDKVFYNPNEAAPGTLNEISSSSYTLDPLKANEAFETFVWGKTTYNFSAAVTYTIQADIEGKNFANAKAVTATNELTTEVKVKDINTAINELIVIYGLPEVSQQSIEFRIKASAGDDATAQYTNTIKALITPYASDIEYPGVHVMGDYSGWSWDNAQKVFSFDGGNVYEAWIFFNGKAANGFKFAIPKSDEEGNPQWDDVANWGLEDGQTPEDEAASIKLWSDGGSKDIKVYSKNYYKFSFDTSTGTLTKVKSMDYFGIIGSGVGGWDPANDVPFEFNNEKQIFEATVTLQDGAIKFRSDHSWDYFNLGQKKDAEEGILSEGGDDISVTAGTYKITVNINNSAEMTYKIEAATAIDPSKITPQVVNSIDNIEMLVSESGAISWVALNFGDQSSATVTYKVEMDLKDANFSNPQVLVESTKETTVNVSGQQFLTALEALGKTMDVATDVDVRVTSTVSGLTNVFTSNTVSFNLTVKDELPVDVKAPLFIVGSVFSAAQDDEYWWKNDASSIGQGLQPMFSENNTIGDGTYEYSGYLNAGEFKLIRTPGNWDTALGRDRDNDGVLISNGGDNIVLAASGWYKMEISTTALTYSITPITAPADDSPYSRIGIIGDATSGAWDTQTELTQLAFNKHLWMVRDVRLKGGLEAKFRANNAWDISWGHSDGFPYGGGSRNNGGNIKVLNTGNYCLMFNDLTDEFIFIKL